jgi:predicted DNA-binding protein (MmcQ/YjbR family)
MPTNPKPKPKPKKKVTRSKPGASAKFRKLAAELRKFASSFPDSREDYPWGERVVKGPNGKVFVFLGDPYMVDGRLCFTVKLPRSRKDVLKLPFAKPCGYGLGKHGWVTLRVGPGDTAPSKKLMLGWIEESWRSVTGGGAAKV